ncbi:MAG: amino acid ABC transporter permease [Gammaproteobacteria bacterium]|nr:amino acid ABC transporter permease [Gammaproteobacteria bacterium]
MKSAVLARYAFPSSALTLLVVLSFFLNWELLLSLDFSVVWEYREVLWRGLLLTLLLTAAAGFLGLFFGTVLAIVSQSPIAVLRWLVAAYVEIWRNTPLLVQLIWIHFALPIVTGISTTALQSGIIGITLQASAYFTEIVRAGIEAVPKGQWEAAHALGLPARTRWLRVVLPPAIRIMIPPLVNLVISFFKATAILSVLQVSELMTVTNRISNVTFKPIELFTAVAVIYFILGYVMSRATLKIEHVLQRSER